MYIMFMALHFHYYGKWTAFM